MPRLKGDGTGDLYLRIRVVLPAGMGDDDRRAAEAFLDLVDQPDPRATTTSNATHASNTTTT
jgi:DnaJ-class molecular chaperone